MSVITLFIFSFSSLIYRSTLQKLAEYGHRQQEELLLRQKQLQQVHDHLMDNSKSILEAQVTLSFVLFYNRMFIFLVRKIVFRILFLTNFSFETGVFVRFSGVV